MANTGPIGEQRNVGTVILLSLVTCGIYGLIWAAKAHGEIKEHSGQGVGSGMGALLYLLFVGVFILPSEIQKMYEADGQKSPVSAATGLWVFLFGIPWYIKVQGALNQYWASKGAPAPS